MGTLSMAEIVVRVLAAFAAGALVGSERELRGRPAGLRTTILACMAAAIAMIIAQTLYEHSAVEVGSGSWRPDPARLGAGILTGIGFLGAGTILRHENFIRGVTTAASLWIVTVLGLAIGCGLYLVSGLGLVLTVATLLALPRLEQFIPTDWYATLKITVAGSGSSEPALIDLIQARGMRVLSMKLRWDQQTGSRTVELDVRCKRQDRFTMCTAIVGELSRAQGVIEAQWM